MTGTPRQRFITKAITSSQNPIVGKSNIPTNAPIFDIPESILNGLLSAPPIDKGLYVSYVFVFVI